MKRLIKTVMCLLLCLAAACPAYAEAAVFAPGDPHAHTLDFRLWFKTMSAQLDACTLSIHEDIYEEKTAQALHEAVSDDLRALEALTGEKLRPHTVYVVEELFAGIQRFENRVYCRAEDIMSGEYRECLTAAALGLEEPWKAVGIAACAWGNKADDGMLSSYYSDADSLDMLSLFAAYFVDEFAGERQMARETAASLCWYVLKTAGYAALTEEDMDAYRQAWLESLDVDRGYTDPFAGWFEGCIYENSAKYPLIVTTKKGDIFYLKPMPGDMETPQEARAFMYEAMHGPQALIEGLRADAPEYADYMAENFMLPIKYYMEPKEDDQSSYANWASREIHLGNTGSVIHETMHVLTRVYAGAAGYDMDQWKVEGIADYLTLRYQPSTGQKEAYFWELTEYGLEPEKGDTERDTAVKQAVRRGREFYLTNNSLPQNAEEIDAYEYVLAMAKAYQLSDWDWKSVGDAYNDLNGKNISQRFVNGLTYNEVFSFTDYLIRTYSLDKFLDFCMGDEFFEEAYNLTYEEAMEGWRQDLLGVE